MTTDWPTVPEFPWEYRGGGWWRERGAPKGTSASILHADEAIEAAQQWACGWAFDLGRSRNHLVELSEPASFQEPVRLIVPESTVYRSPAGNHCVGWSWLDDDSGDQRFTLLAFRRCSPAEVEP